MATFGCMLRTPVCCLLLGALAPAVTAAQQAGSVPRDSAGPPALLTGTFVDDYDSRYTITREHWTHGTRSRYHVLKWNVAGQYLIARNDENNPGDQGLFTRIDWMPLEMPPFTWAFCMTAFSAPTADSAEKTLPAKRETPRTGCGGFPFSRMKRSSP
jgi:hypothetical protein